MYWLQGLSGSGELSRVFGQKLPRTVPNWPENAHDIAERRRKPLEFWEKVPARNESTTTAHAGCAGAVTGCSDGSSWPGLAGRTPALFWTQESAFCPPSTRDPQLSGGSGSQHLTDLGEHVGIEIGVVTPVAWVWESEHSDRHVAEGHLRQDPAPSDAVGGSFPRFPASRSVDGAPWVPCRSARRF